MTLILNCLTDQFAVQVSDRRITYVTGPNAGKVMDDARNKAVLWNGLVTIGFTGFTPFEGEDTDLWLARTLVESAGMRGTNPLHYLRDRATIALKKAKRYYGVVYPHIFSGVGFVARGPLVLGTPARIEPYEFLVSNVHDESGALYTSPRDSFVVLGLTTGPRQHGWFHISAWGQAPRPDGMEKLRRNVQRMLRDGRGPAAISHELQAAVRAVARSHDTVGKNLLVACVPRISAEKWFAEHQAVVSASRPNLSDMTYLWSSVDGQGVYSPRIVVRTQYFGDLRSDSKPFSTLAPELLDTREGDVVFNVSIALPEPPKERLYP